MFLGLRKLVVCSALVVVISGVSRVANATVIGVGLDWRSGVFVQEVWHHGAPQYLIANLSKAAVQITVHEFDASWRLGQPLPKAEAGPWKIAASGQLLVDAKPLVGDKLYRFVVDGKQPLGLLPGAKDSGYEGDGFSSRLGLNGSGGSVPGVYLVQPKLEAIAGAPLKVVLHLPSKCGVLKFQRSPDKIDDPLRPANLIVASATSKTLTITSDDKQIAIDTQTPKTDAATHEVELTIQVPEIKTAQLCLVGGWLANSSGGGNGITRGFWIVPKK